MQVPRTLQKDYREFLERTGFQNENPQALLMELASLSMDVYFREVAWLSEFLGKVKESRDRAA
ncbi:hypothetical protein [Roseibium sediminis]|uniref:hypothetical protein n=1 Tax=Roseibium sediminis TaxID=1775174 RepID=UPI00123CF7DF|nr:hypothetical protein [Roseibium sediminis]